MTAQDENNASKGIDLSDDDVTFLLTILRDVTRAQPVTTQQLIDALRGRSDN